MIQLLSLVVVEVVVLAFASALSSSSTSTTTSSSSSSFGSSLLQQQPQQQQPLPPLFSLQDAHALRSPAEVLRELASSASDSNDRWDVYGDFDKDASESFLRRFEAELASEFGYDDAVFMPSGVMAQSIALLIHGARSSSSKKSIETERNHADTRSSSSSSSSSSMGRTIKKKKKKKKKTAAAGPYFICHESSHLLLHEQDAYRELLNVDAIVVSTRDRAELNQHGIPIVPPMRFKRIHECMAFRARKSSYTIL
jgi:Beta-eliminating lyase